VLSRFEDGKIAEEWFNFDQLRLLQQLGSSRRNSVRIHHGCDRDVRGVRRHR
jgi:hypothetical protein